MITRHGWLLHHDAVFWAVSRMRMIEVRATGCGLKARQERRLEVRRSSVSIGRPSILFHSPVQIVYLQIQGCLRDLTPA